MADERRHAWELRHADGRTLASPSPFVVAALDTVTRRDTRARASRALDLACGSGRHALLLAAYGYRVTAVDYSHAAVARVAAVSRSRRLAVDCLVADVTQWPLPPARYDLIVVVDFLERALFPALRVAVAPGGALIMETFLHGHERFGRPTNPDFLLRPRELTDVFGDWNVRDAYEGETTTAAGAPAMRAGIVATRPHVDTPEPFGSAPRT